LGWNRRRDPSSEPLDRHQAYDAAVAILALRPHLEAELGRKLAARGAPSDVVEEVLARLHDQQLLDDDQIARRFAAETSAHRHWGTRRIEAELRQRGATAAVAARAVEELGDPLELARRAAERWLRRHGGTISDQTQVARLARHLSGLGHSPQAIGTLIAALPGDAAIDIEE
jgi:regulatory protein